MKFEGKIHSKKGVIGEYEQDYNEETGEITLTAKFKVDRNTKDGKRIFYYSYIDHVPITSYFTEKVTYRKVGGEKEEADEQVKIMFGIDM